MADTTEEWADAITPPNTQWSPSTLDTPHADVSQESINEPTGETTRTSIIRQIAYERAAIRTISNLKQIDKYPSTWTTSSSNRRYWASRRLEALLGQLACSTEEGVGSEVQRHHMPLNSEQTGLSRSSQEQRSRSTFYGTNLYESRSQIDSVGDSLNAYSEIYELLVRQARLVCETKTPSPSTPSPPPPTHRVLKHAKQNRHSDGLEREFCPYVIIHNGGTPQEDETAWCNNNLGTDNEMPLLVLYTDGSARREKQGVAGAAVTYKRYVDGCPSRWKDHA